MTAIHDEKLRIGRSLELIYNYGGIDGAHHKQWLIDQLLRTLACADYEEWVKNYEGGGDYEWDKGMAP